MMQLDMMAVEDLHIKGLVQSNLAKSISDAAWGTFVNILTCKAAEAGRPVVKVPVAYTSQTCATCGRWERKKLSDWQHICAHCGFNTHCDHNAALVIWLGRGLSSPLKSLPITRLSLV